ncbi:MAG TPA: class I SAM-dependent methyltransferase [Nitratifractor sp.]|nr:class I SAM-dependent methyltransferase [Nitratifractor sp.]HHH20436.1 class I SAM-dependent methyltransferase [Nitratifractor sp.]
MVDKFANSAKEYDNKVKQQRNVADMAKSIVEAIKLDKSHEILDFGAGSGLLTKELSPYVKKITAVDISPSMLEILASKSFDCEVELLERDLVAKPLEKQFDAIVSSMTLHHISDIPHLLKHFFDALHSGGRIALCDLYPEDGSFHSADTGVAHLGLDPNELVKFLESVGFCDIKVTDSVIINKQQGQYPTFVVSAEKLKES